MVAVTAVPVRLPLNISVDNTFVEGLYSKLPSLDKPTPVPVAFNEKTMEWFVLFAPAARLIFWAVVAVPVRLPVTFPVTTPIWVP